MILPFSDNNFARDAKPLLSGINTSLEFENIESSLQSAALIFIDSLTEPVYTAIINGSLCDDTGTNTALLDFLKRSLLHFAVYDAIPYLAVHIGNEGITTVEADGQKSAYKYQQDQLQEKLLKDAWMWMDRLIKALNDSGSEVWAETDHKNGISDLPIRAIDMERYIGVTDVAFIYFAAPIIREVIRQCVDARSITTLDEQVKEAICNEVMARAIRRLPYNHLPESIRHDINNEQTKSNQESPEVNVRDRLGNVYGGRATRLWQVYDDKRAAASAPSVAQYQPQRRNDSNEKFVMG